jgi:hypothetical protein
VAVYGGFAGTESTLAERDWRDHRAILSGDFDGDDQTDAAGVTEDCADVVGTNSRHVVQTRDVDSTTLIDGFTITAGAADTNGGGWLNVGGDPILTNLRFQGNCATSAAGRSTTRTAAQPSPTACSAAMPLKRAVAPSATPPWTPSRSLQP